MRSTIKLLLAARNLMSAGPLAQDGWVRSHLEGESVDAQGRPIPWFTYAAIDFLTSTLPSVQSVFEYGCGNGTLWWAERSTEVLAVEHDASWYRQVEAKVPSNVRLLHRTLEQGASYEDAIDVDDRRYDVIVVDGRLRNRCMKKTPGRATAEGVIILDNSDRPGYAEGIDHLTKSGFRKICFSGFCPIVNCKSQTAVFYRDKNILGI